MSDNIAIQVNGLSKEYSLYDHHADRVKEVFHPLRKKYHKTFNALRDVSFTVSKGEFFGVIGRNGSGKSTLLQMICGIMMPTHGDVHVNGRIAALLELGAGFNPEFTGRENVYLNGSILGFTRDEMDLLFDEILEFSEIGDFIDQPVKTYSSGMYVRLAFSVQACVEPDVLVVDEALAVGDIFFRQKCYKRLRELLDKGCTVLLVTHAMNDVEQFCQNAILLDHGEVKFLGSAVEAVKRYYLLEQGQQIDSAMPDDSQFDDSLRDVKSADDLSEKNEDHFWPESEAYLDLSNVSDVSNGWAECTCLAICNEKGEAAASFYQGDTISFYFEVKFLHDIQVPIAGVEIINDKGIIVHGKTTMEYGTAVPNHIKSGSRLRFRQSIKLNVGPGEYSFSLGITCMSAQDYEKIGYMDNLTLHSKLIRMSNLTNVSLFAVCFRKASGNVQVPFHGIADLPGTCKLV